MLRSKVMTDNTAPSTVVHAHRDIAASAEQIFELIADPSKQPMWDGNANLAEAAANQRVSAVGDVFTMTLTQGGIRENRVVEFEEQRRIAWLPAERGAEPPGHLWRWELAPTDGGRTRVTHTYDWSELTDPRRLAIARTVTSARLLSSLDKLARYSES